MGAFLRSAGSEFQALVAKIVNESCPKNLRLALVFF